MDFPPTTSAEPNPVSPPPSNDDDSDEQPVKPPEDDPPSNSTPPPQSQPSPPPQPPPTTSPPPPRLPPVQPSPSPPPPRTASPPPPPQVLPPPSSPPPENNTTTTPPPTPNTNTNIPPRSPEKNKTAPSTPLPPPPFLHKPITPAKPNSTTGVPSSPSPPNAVAPKRVPPSSSSTQNSTSIGRSTPSMGEEALGGSGSSEVNVPLVVGLTAGLSLFLIMIAMVFLCCVKKGKKKPRPYGGTNYYTDTSVRRGTPAHINGGEYFAPPPTWTTGVPISRDHIVPLPPGRQHPSPSVPSAPAGVGNETPLYSSDSSGGAPGGYRPSTPPSPASNLPQLGFNKSTFTYEELAAATGGFSQANLLGQGGFGYVHKGVLPGPSGKEVAVKSLKDGSGQGEREFQAEVEIISRVHHRHLVSLVGYCIADGQRMLVYEFVPNKTLQFHLHGKDRPTMSFATRLKIALGSAKGLAYLHEDCHPKIIHRDIKAANILLDNKFEAMVYRFLRSMNRTLQA